MPTTTIAPTEARRRAVHLREHLDCFACGTSEAPGGLGLNFKVDPHGDGVTAEWTCPASFHSYTNTVHGGLIATVLDSAMVHALFARDVIARTADLQVRYVHPVSTEVPITIAARLVQQFGRLFKLEGTLTQDSRVCARARASFMRPPS